MNIQHAVHGTTGPESAHRCMSKAAARIDECRLLTEARSGCSGAFGKLYERHRSRVYRTALRILRNEQDAEDAAQRSFQRAFTNLASFRGNSTFSTWLTRVAINEALMLLRQRRTNPRLFEGGSDDDYECSVNGLADEGPTPEEVLATKELRAAVTQAISGLRKGLRIVVILRELQGLTSAETAQRLGLSVAAVKGRVFHAKRYLRRHLEDKFRAARSRRNNEIVSSS
jgi:RNA polymerase sigma-70 factor, ECF subfamily